MDGAPLAVTDAGARCELATPKPMQATLLLDHDQLGLGADGPLFYKVPVPG